MRRKLLFLSAFLLGGSALVANGPMGLQPVFPRPWPAPYRTAARTAVVSPFLTQARNADALDQTLWNDYFTKNGLGDGLTHSAMQNLDRLARKQLDFASQGPTTVYVQRLRDTGQFPTTSDLQDKREITNTNRLAIVRRYFATIWPQAQVVVAMSDAYQPVMSGVEAITGFDKIRFISQGFIPSGLLQGGIKAALDGTVTRGVTAPPISEPGKSGAGAITDGGGSGE